MYERNQQIRFNQNYRDYFAIKIKKIKGLKETSKW